jgi:hypothetical protein
MLKVGKLYSCPAYYLFLYPDKDTAAAGGEHPLEQRQRVGLFAGEAAYWSRKSGKPVSYCNPLTPLLVLSVKEKYIEVLAGDKKGWIINEDWLELKKISCP